MLLAGTQNSMSITVPVIPNGRRVAASADYLRVHASKADITAIDIDLIVRAGSTDRAIGKNSLWFDDIQGTINS